MLIKSDLSLMVLLFLGLPLLLFVSAIFIKRAALWIRQSLLTRVVLIFLASGRIGCAITVDPNGSRVISRLNGGNFEVLRT